MFRSSTFDKLLDKATSNLQLELDWPTVLQICDLIRSNEVTPRNALLALKKKLTSTNPHQAMFAVQLLESMVKNCGNSLHDELTSQAYCECLHDLVKNTPHDDVRQKMLELIQAWTHAFRKTPKYSALRETMNAMRMEGYKFPTLRESDAMFAADSAPEWVDGEVCHRCRTQFNVMNRKHHCRACGQVFCKECSSKTSTLPKFGIEKEVRVCDACYDHFNKPPSSSIGSKDPEIEEYLKSSLAQQNQEPPRKTQDEIREEEELQLAIALSQSEAEAKEKEKLRVTSAYFNNYKQEQPIIGTVKPERSSSPLPEHPELSRYLNRQYWENRPQDVSDTLNETTNSPSAPAAGITPPVTAIPMVKAKENGFVDVELEEFVHTLKSQVEIFINRMKSNSSRGRSIANDSSVQTLFMNITAMHSKLLKYIQQHDDSRLYYERLQDKLTQVKDARAALDALREEHREKLRRQAEEAERQRQMLMAHKLEIMRKKKQEYLQYQRQIALQRIQEQEREMHMRQEQQKQQYMMGPQQYYMGSPVHGGQFAGAQPQYATFNPPPPPSPQLMINNMQPTSMPGSMKPCALPNLQNMRLPPTGALAGPNTIIPPQGLPQHTVPGTNAMIIPPNANIMPHHGQMMPQQALGQLIPNSGVIPPPPAGGNQYGGGPPQAANGQMQPGAPPASPRMAKEETTTGELITFD